MHRGHILEETNKLGTPLYKIKSYLPVIEAFGFWIALKNATGGQAFPQLCVFDHWDMLPCDPLEPGSGAEQLVMDIRRRKGLWQQITPLFELEDML
ncbi:Translation elongation factor EFG [Macleaya cordata]|uniref:Translation elongation factor EFG n=1 Tax=Macleaya cordata TaxID=56857 RepID=A0A200QN39_MACCD|nr:Translation elongation factor EFG [Macleaya cordata]